MPRKTLSGYGRIKAFVNSPKAVAMRREYVKYKGSLERGLVAVRREKRRGRRIAMRRHCRRCLGKILAHMMGGRRLGGGRARGRQDGGRRGENGGRTAEGRGRRVLSKVGGVIVGAAGHVTTVVRTRRLKLAVRLGRAAHRSTKLTAGRSKAHGGRSVPATSNLKGSGWDSVVVEESDILACGGYLPEKYIGGGGEGEPAAAPRG